MQEAAHTNQRAWLTGREERQFKDVAEEDDTQDSQDWLDLKNPKRQAATQGEGEASKSTGKTGDQPEQAEGGATVPPKENTPAPLLTDPEPGTSKDPTDPPAVNPTQAPT